MQSFMGKNMPPTPKTHCKPMSFGGGVSTRSFGGTANGSGLGHDLYSEAVTGVSVLKLVSTTVPLIVASSFLYKSNMITNFIGKVVKKYKIIVIQQKKALNI